jgi:DNA repair protein RadD
MLRPYQQAAHDAIVKHIVKYRAPCLIEAATGAGKSHIIAALADTIHKVSKGKRVLCIAPSGELVLQNSEKYAMTGNKFSLFSASVGEKSLKHPVVFGTPMTIKNKIKEFGKDFALIVIDEAHGITPTVKEIVDAIRRENNNVRVVGMTATPYRMLDGHIFSQWDNGAAVSEDQAKDPYFSRLVYRITASELIMRGYLTPPKIGSINAEAYHTLDMQLNSRGQFNADDVDRAYIGQGRKTAKIIADLVEKSRDRQGVMVFAATVQHAKECLESLPSELSALVTGDTPKDERKKIIAAFKARRIKYLVNVSVLTTGFDAPHVDVVALLRATESPGLLQQIIGRGLRTSEGKEDCLILDYAENFERHCPDGDLFNPHIRTSKFKTDVETLECVCPECNATNTFVARVNKEKYFVDHAGYFIDLDGARIPSEFGDIPAHMGRRCGGLVPVGGGDLDRCRYRWTYKPCELCGAENDIAARYCCECKAELVDPNKKLTIQYAEMKKDPTKMQTDCVMSWSAKKTISKAGRPMIKIDVATFYMLDQDKKNFRTFSFWVPERPDWNKGIEQKRMFDALEGKPPQTITYRKDEQGWYKVFGYNRNPDEIPK